MGAGISEATGEQRDAAPADDSDAAVRCLRRTIPGVLTRHALARRAFRRATYRIRAYAPAMGLIITIVVVVIIVVVVLGFLRGRR